MILIHILFSLGAIFCLVLIVSPSTLCSYHREEAEEAGVDLGVIAKDEKKFKARIRLRGFIGLVMMFATWFYLTTIA